MKSRAPGTIGAVVTAIFLLAGCAATPAPYSAVVSAPSASATPSTLGVGFWDPSHPPAPEGTINPTPDSWSEAHPPAGYTVVLLTYGDDAPTKTLVAAVKSWAAEEHVALTTVVGASHDTLLAAVNSAVLKKPDLVISVGNDMIDALAAATPSVLAQQFLVIGAEIAEPTYNVTAADWTGAGFRGEGLGTPSHYDPKTFTSERAGRALRAGVAAVVNDLTGIVIWVS